MASKIYVSPRFKTERALCCINIVIVFAVLIFVPIGLAAYFRQPVLFGLTPLIALFVACWATAAEQHQGLGE
jgi:hypothetical protein